MSSRAIEDVYGLSFAQHEWLLHSLQFKESGLAFLQIKFTLVGDMDVELFRRAWQRVVDRHPMLRTSYHWRDVERPLQVVHRNVTLPFVENDLRGASSATQKERLDEALGEDRERGFDLSRPPLMRIALFRLARSEYEFVWSVHHLVMDGWSAFVVCKEAFDFYDAFLSGRNPHIEPPRPFKDYISWLEQQDLSAAEAFWKEQLRGFKVPTMLPFDRAPAGLPVEVDVFEREETEVSEAATAALRLLAREHRLTSSTVLAGSWALLLSRHSGRDDVLFGVTVSGRPAALGGIEGMVGLFINTLPLRVRLSGDHSLVRWLEQIQGNQMSVARYQYSSLPEIQRCSEMPLGRRLFDTALIVENYPRDESLSRTYGSLSVCNCRGGVATNYPLTAVVIPGRKLRLQIRYDERRFDSTESNRLLEEWNDLLHQVPRQVEHGLSPLEVLGRGAGSSLPHGRSSAAGSS